MDELEPLCDLPRDVKFAGRRLQLRGLRLRDWAWLSREARSEAERSWAATADLAAWCASPEGAAAVLWRAARDTRARPRRAWFRRATARASRRRRDAVLGEVWRLSGIGPATTSGDRSPAAPRGEVCWSNLWRELAERYGWRPAEIARLTLGQAVACLPAGPRRSREWLSPAETRRRLAERRGPRIA
jgi:hypothetical protein